MQNKQFQKGRVFTISFAHFAHDVYSSFLAPILPLLIEKLGISLFMSAFLDITRNVPSLLNPFFGILAEKTGARYFVILTPAITAISMSLLGLAPNYSIVFILLFVAGISAALFHVPSPTMIKESSGDKVGTGMSFFMVGGEAARTLGPLLATAGISWWGFEGIYKLMPLGIIASIILYFKLKDIHITRPLQKPKEKGDIRRLLKQFTPFFGVLSGFIIFQSTMKRALTLFLPVYLVGQGESLWYAGISLSILQGFGVLGTMFSGNISDRIGRQKTLLITTTGSVIAMALFINTGSMFFLAFLGLFLLSTGPVLMATVQDTNSTMPIFMNSVYMSINFGIGSLVVFAVGLSGDILGLHTTYIICNLIALGCIPMAYFLTKTIR